MSIQLVAAIAGLIITWLIFTWFIKVFKASLKTAVTIALILFCLQVFFGIKSQQIWQEFIKLTQELLSRFLELG